MFGFNIGEMLLLAAIALIAIGPKQLPEVARVVGKLLNEFKRATGDFHRTLNEANDSTSKTIADVHQTITQAVAPVKTSLEEMHSFLHQQVSPQLSGQTEPNTGSTTVANLEASRTSSEASNETSPQVSFPMADLANRELPKGDLTATPALDDQNQLSFNFNTKES